MKVELTPRADAATEQAVRIALSGVAVTSLERRPGSAGWKRAALDEGVEREPTYDAPPRNNRGAARA